MVESTGLENRRTRKGIVSSNLTLSACGSSEQSHSALDRRIAPPARLAQVAVLSPRMSLDRWPSGLRRTPGKCVYVKAYREFESHPIRLQLVKQRPEMGAVCAFRLATAAVSALAFFRF